MTAFDWNPPPKPPPPDVRQVRFEALNTLRKRYGLRDVRAGVWDALCPAHEDRNRSMRVYSCDDGDLYFTCYAGCDWRLIRAVLGMPNARAAAGDGSRRPDATAPRPAPRYNFAHLAAMFRLPPAGLMPLAAELGVSAESLADGGVGRMLGYPMHVAVRNAEVPVTAWTFPMADAAANVIGLRLRFADGAKRSFTDSAAGLFVGRRWGQPGPIVVCEGPTDRAAVADWGFDAIGKPSCNDGDELVDEMLRGVGGKRDVVILSNLDEPKRRPHDGTVFYPGQDGAEKLAARVAYRCKSLRVITPPPGLKDARAWLRAGGTRADVLAMIGSKGTWRPERKRSA